MKKLVILLVIMVSQQVSAQSDYLDQFYQKYKGKEGFTSISITQKMFKLFAKLTDDDESRELEELLQNMEGIKIIAYDASDSEQKAIQSMGLFDELYDQVNRNSFEDLMDVDGDDEQVKFMVRENTQEEIEELLMLVGSTDSFVLISLRGLIDLEKIAKLSKGMNIGGLENLEKLNQKN